MNTRIIVAVIAAVATIIGALIEKPAIPETTLVSDGTVSTSEIHLASSLQPRTVKLSAHGECRAGVGGSMRWLRIFRGSSVFSSSGDRYRNPPLPELLS